jgi:phosphoglycolate phosphatase-like HAD superfamily hydrolase
MNEICVFDCDGVLVDSSHRYRNLPTGSIDLPYWLENCTPEKIAADRLLPTAEIYRECLNNPNIYTVIATARQVQQHDLEYFRDRLGFPQHLIARKVGEKTPDWLLKFRGLRRLLNLRQFAGKPVSLYEDNPVTLSKFAELFPHWNLIHIPSNQGA